MGSSNFKDRVIIKGRQELWRMPEFILYSDVIDNFNIALNPEDFGGALLDDGSNLVVDVGREVTAKVMSGEWPPDPITTFCVGTGGYTTPPQCDTPPNPPLGTDTDLYNQSFSKPIQSIEHPNMAADTFVTLIEATEWNGYEFSEWGLKLQSGKLYSRRTTKPYPKDSSFAILSKWTIQY